MSEQTPELRKAALDALDALYVAHQFVQSVVGWNGGPDDRDEAEQDLEESIKELEEVL